MVSYWKGMGYESMDCWAGRHWKCRVWKQGTARALFLRGGLKFKRLAMAF